MNILTKLIFLFLIFIPSLLKAQFVSGYIKEENGKPVAGASVTLKNKMDSSIVKLEVSKTDGHYEFPSISKGNYFINISHVGFQAYNSSTFEVTGTANTTVPPSIILAVSSNLQQVTVTATKPVIEIKADKMVMNVEGSINAVGQDALELLRKSPGVLVDKDDNLSLSGKNGVQVYIDGRPSPLSGKDLSNYLKTLQSTSIEAIEIITNPSAKYDAAGNAGIINIRLKKNKLFGTNGSVTAGYNIGTYPKYNGGFSLNHRNKKINAFGNYTINRSLLSDYINIYRIQLDTIFDSQSENKLLILAHNYKAGLDYLINDRNTIGVMINGNFSNLDFSNLSTTKISYQPTGTPERTLIADNTNEMNRRQANANLNYRYADSSGRTLNMDADYGFYRIHSDQLQPNYYFDPAGSPLDSRIYNMIAPTDINIYTYKTDYEQNFKKGKLGLGGKVSYVKSSNDFQRFNVDNAGVKDLDKDRSNDFNYTENINALYINYNRPFKSFSLQFGLRAEQTNAEGISNGLKWTGSDYKPYDSSFKRNYLDFFPSAAISFTKNPKSQFNITFSRRIDRPAYQDLNPFEFKLDEYNYEKGNTDLRPQYTNSFGISHTYQYKLTTSLNYSHVDDVFTQLIDTAERSKSFITKKNLANQDIASLNISYPFSYKKYSVFTNVNSYYSHFKANLGVGRKIDLEVYAVNIYMQHSLKFGKDWTAEVSGFYNSPSLWEGTFKNTRMWSVDAGLQKLVLKGKGNVKVSVSDVFKTLKWAGTSNFAGQYVYSNGGWESRQLKLFFTYRFGNTQVKGERQRKTGLDDENQRVGGAGGNSR